MLIEPVGLNKVLLVDKYLDLFLILVLQEPEFVPLNPYLLACAII